MFVSFGFVYAGLAVSLAILVWLFFMIVLGLLIQVVCGSHVEVKLSRNKPSKQPFWEISSFAELCKMSTNTTSRSYPSDIWLDEPLGYCLELVGYVVPQ